MSRIGKAPITIPSGVTIDVSKGNEVKVKGPKGELTQQIDREMEIKVDEKEVEVVRPTEQKRHKSMHGLSRTLISNMIVGVTEGYKQQLEVVGVGYKISDSGQKLEMSLGFSHDIVFVIPDEVKVTTETVKGKNPLITLESHNKELLGQIVAKIRQMRKPEPYKGKGIKYVGEYIRRKAGKTAAK